MFNMEKITLPISKVDNRNIKDGTGWPLAELFVHIDSSQPVDFIIEAANNYEAVKKVNEDLIKLLDEVLSWWNDHEFDTVKLSDGDEDNLWDGTPDFILIAKRLKANI